MPAKQEGPGSLRSTVFFLTMWCFTQQRNRKIKPLSRGQSISSISSIGDKLEPLLMTARWDCGSLNRTAPEEKGLWSTLGSSALTELYVGQSLDDQSCCFKKFSLLENWVCMPDSKVSVSELTETSTSNVISSQNWMVFYLFLFKSNTYTAVILCPV